MDLTTGVGKPFARVAGWWVYPNPGDRQFVLGNEMGYVATFELMDGYGRVLGEYEVAEGERAFRLSLAAGVYFMRERHRPTAGSGGVELPSTYFLEPCLPKQARLFICTLLLYALELTSPFEAIISLTLRESLHLLSQSASKKNLHISQTNPTFLQTFSLCKGMPLFPFFWG